MRIIAGLAVGILFAGGCHTSENTTASNAPQQAPAEPSPDSKGTSVAETPAQQLRQILGAMKHRAVSYGWGGIEIGDGTDLSSARAMFPDAPRGQAVIGTLTLTGDPIGVDLSRSDFPVWTCSHDDEEWNPTVIAGSLALFDRALALVADAARGRDSADAVEKNPLSNPEIEKVVSAIRTIDPKADATFWREFFEH